MKGIRGLTPLLEQLQKPVHMKEFAGQRVAVDGHAWLLAAALPWASEITRGVETNAYITSFMGLVMTLCLNNVVPIIVFEGQTLPMKQHMEVVKTKQRKTLIERGKNLFEQGKLNRAKQCFEKAFTVSQVMVAKIIKELDRMKIQHIIAPYESASQLAFMLSEHQVKAIVSEKTDVLAFGASKVIFNMDRQGQGQLVEGGRLLKNLKINKHQFRYLCILSGSDILKPLPGVVFKTALSMVRRQRTIEQLSSMVQMKFEKRISNNYIRRFKKLNDAHLYQFIYDKDSNRYERMNRIPAGLLIEDPGQTPDNLDIPILRTNNAVYIDPLEVIRNENKENIWPWGYIVGVEFIAYKKSSKSESHTIFQLQNNVQPKPLDMKPYTPDLKRKSTFNNSNKTKSRRL